jgi:hypothetical protein
MRMARFVTSWFAGCLICVGGVARAADPTPEDMLRFRPTQEGINISTPAGAELAACKVEPVSANNVSGLLLRDAKGRPVRRILDTNGDRRPDIWCYYLEGVEVYREMDPGFEGKATQFRWLNSGGMKWGIDVNKDGKIDSWRMISAEEVSQEILQAIITRDYARFRALFVSDEELAALGLPQQEMARIQDSIKGSEAKFKDLTTKLAHLGDKTHWLHLETSAPQCILAEHLGSKYDVIKYGRSTILCETATKHDWIQAGEMMMVRTACWRIIDCPVMGEGSGTTQETASTDPELQRLLDKLRELDAQAPKGLDAGSQAKEIVEYNLARATLIEELIKKVKQDEREGFVRQLADCLGAAVQNSGEGDGRAYERLGRLKQQIVSAVPGTQVAAYVTFREMQAENAITLSKKGADVNKAQDQWLQHLAKFIEAYPTAEDAPDALMQLGMVSEFVNKEVDAKKWYEMLIKNFRAHPLAAKAAGAMRRLDIEGKPLELSGPTLDGGAFNIGQLRGKTVIVYYWASWNKERTVGDFASLKLLQNTYASRGVELVCVNLDNSAREAQAFLQQVPSTSVQLFQPGGLDSPLATQYGVMVLPNLFLVDKEGKVISRTIQVGNLEEELKKRTN